jgi:micrococcal nuclease
VIRRAAIGILCLAAVAVGIWWFVPRDSVVAADPIPSPAAIGRVIPGIPVDAFEMTVESVHDGDTLRARVSTPNAVVTDLESTRVRLIGLDAPEISPSLECWGGEATVRLTELVPPGSTVWAAPDSEVLDQYGRHLLYLWTPDGRFVNAELLSEGDGAVMVFAPNTLHEALFRALESEAAVAARGMWGAC